MKKPLKTLLYIVMVVALAVFSLFSGRAVRIMTIHIMDENEAKAYILEQVQSQIDEMRKEYDIPDLQVELEFTKYEVTKPALYKDGDFLCEAVIEIEFQDYFVSDTFAELDDYTEEDMKLYSCRYAEIPEIRYMYVTENFSIELTRADNDCEVKQLYRTPDGNIYGFDRYSVYKNGDEFCKIPYLY